MLQRYSQKFTPQTLAGLSSGVLRPPGLLVGLFWGLFCGETLGEIWAKEGGNLLPHEVPALEGMGWSREVSSDKLSVASPAEKSRAFEIMQPRVFHNTMSRYVANNNQVELQTDEKKGHMRADI